MSGIITSTPLLVSNTYDPNWYLSTIVQSTAALIAILGGFLISRLVALSAEKNTLTNKLQEIEKTRMSLFGKYDQISNKIHTRAMNWFQEDSLQTIVDNPDISPEELCEIGNYEGEIKEEKQKFAEILIGKSKSFHTLLNEKYPGLSKIPTEKSDLDQAGFSITSEFEKELVIEIATKMNRIRDKEREEREREAAKNPDNPFARIFSAQTGLSGLFNNQKDLAASFAFLATPRLPIVRIHGKNSEIQLDYANEIESLGTQISIYRDLIDSRARPSGIIHGFLVLVYFGIVGIAIPLFSMTKNPVTLHGSGRIVVYSLFLSGLIWLFIYIGNSIRSIFKKY